MTSGWKSVMRSSRSLSAAKAWCVGDGLDAPQHGEQPCQRVHVARQQLRCFLGGQAHHVAAERVDDVVERLVRHRLALVAAPAQDDRVVVLDELVGEAAHQRALAHARQPVHEHGDRLALLRLLERHAQRLQVCVAPDEELAVLAGVGGRLGVEDGRRCGVARQVAQDLGAAGAAPRVTPQQVAAELIEVVGDAADHLRRRDRLELLLLAQDLEHGSVERQLSSERFVQDGAGAVPVAGRRDRLAGGLLGRHIGGRAEHAAPDGAVLVLRLGRDDRLVADQAEVEHDDASLGRDQHVARLDVAMQLAGVV
jgi:hypothetical protein